MYRLLEADEVLRQGDECLDGLEQVASWRRIDSEQADEPCSSDQTVRRLHVVWVPTIETCAFVPASCVADGLPKAWQALIESQPPFTWGDNNRSMISVDDLRRHMEELDSTDEIEQFVARLDAIPESVPYVDLEN